MVKRIKKAIPTSSQERCNAALTPSLKLVRAAVLERHAELVAALQSGAAHAGIIEVQRREE